MMNVQLLLLLALAGPFCAFTHASPTQLTAEPDLGITATADVIAEGTEATEATKVDFTVVTGPPATNPPAAPEEVATDVVTEAAPPSFNTEKHAVETEAPAPASTEAPEPIITDAPAVVTAAPTDSADKDQAQATGAAEADIGDEVVVEDKTEEGLSSGQVVGIVIGALLAVVIVIAVVIAVVRRMGKYSSAKNKKPAKKDSVMVSPLRKKPAKQQERSKFWKF